MDLNKLIPKPEAETFWTNEDKDVFIICQKDKDFTHIIWGFFHQGKEWRQSYRFSNILIYQDASPVLENMSRNYRKEKGRPVNAGLVKLDKVTYNRLAQENIEANQ